MTRLLVPLLLGLALAGCTSSTPPSSSPSRTPSSATDAATPTPSAAPKPPPAPRSGACYRMSYDAALAPTTHRPPAPCRRPHTSETYATGALDTVVGGRLLTVDSRHVQDMLARTCPDRLAEFVGGTLEQRRLSVLRSVWFTPTVKQSEAGANWFRCDVVAVARDDRLQPVTGSLRGVLTTEAGRERYGVCGTAEPGTKGFQRVICSAAHSWRAIRTVPLPASDYPGQAAARRAGQDPCRAAAKARAADPLDFRWGYEWPDAEQWRAGRRFGLCWVPDRGA